MWPQLIAAVFGIIDKVLPDPQAAVSAKMEALKLQASADGQALEAQTRLALAQIDTNKADAQGSAMQRNWRPMIGWVCAAALASQYVLRPWVQWAGAVTGHPLPELPGIDGQLWELMAGMLGLGGLRTLEKVKGAA